MTHITPFYAGESRKQHRALDQKRAKETFSPRFSEDLTGYYLKEACYIAKCLGVPYRTIIICDHPCGELTIFVRQNGKLHWQGYVDFWFYEDMDNDRPLGQAMAMAYD